MTEFAAAPSPGAKAPIVRRGGFRRRHLLALAGAAALPVLVFAVVVVLLFSQEQRRNIEAQLLQLARGTVNTGDLILASRIATLENLAVLARSGELEGTRAQVHRLLALGNQAWLAFSVDDGRQHNILFEQRSGTPLPAEALSRGATDPHGRLGVESAVVVGDVEGKRLPVLVLRVPLGASAPGSFVTGVLSPAAFSAALTEQGVPEGWTAAVLNSDNVIVGRSRSPDEFVGTPATSSLAERLRLGSDGFFFTTNKEGQPVYTAFATSRATGWSAAVGAPKAVITGPLRRSELALVGGGAAAVLCALALALLLVRNIATRNESERRAMRAEADQQTERRLADIAAHFPGLIYRRVLHPDGTFTYPYVGGGAAALLGVPREDGGQAQRSVEELAGSYLKPADRERWKQAVTDSARTLADYDVDGEFRRPDGETKWLRSIASTHPGEDGSVIWDGLILDITDLKNAQAALLQETRTLETINGINAEIAAELDLDRLAQSVTDAGTRLSGARFGAFFYKQTDQRDGSFTGQAVSGMDRDAFARLPIPQNATVFDPVALGHGVVRIADVTRDSRYGNGEVQTGAGADPVLRSYLAVPVTTRFGETIGGLFFGHPEAGAFRKRHERIVAGIAAQAAIGMDNARLFGAAEREIAERKRAEEHQALLVAELNHRVRNTLAIVLSIAQQTSKHADSLETFGKAFTGRIHALAGAHTLLSDSNWTTTSLRTLAENAVAAHTGPLSQRVSITGPDLLVPPRPAVALGLILHELATNAAKYGALSVAHGKVDVTWQLEPDGKQVYFRWEENNGPRVSTPTRTGFGTQLIELNVTHELSGKRLRTYRPEGLVCELWFPLSALGEA